MTRPFDLMRRMRAGVASLLLLSATGSYALNTTAIVASVASPDCLEYRVVAVGDDQYVGCEGDGAEHGQGRRQRHDETKGSPARRERGKGCRHVACPES